MASSVYDNFICVSKCTYYNSRSHGIAGSHPGIPVGKTHPLAYMDGVVTP